jgi:hypothetical protein
MTGLLLQVALFPLGTTDDCAIGQAGPSILSRNGHEDTLRAFMARAAIRNGGRCSFRAA